MTEIASRLPPGVRAVIFDAVGTLLQLDPSAADVYADFAQRYGSRLGREEIGRRFAVAFAAQERLDASRGLQTDEAHELQRWQQIVVEVISDVDDSAAFFDELYNHFALPQSWKCDPDAQCVIATLQANGLIVGMASNFDHRLRPIVAGLPPLAGLDRLFISSEIGHKKPSKRFFQHVCAELGMPPGRVLMVGDDLENDHAGAQAAGLHALLLDPRGKSSLPQLQRLQRLRDLTTQ